MEGQQKRNSVPIGIGIGIDQDQIDDIEDLQSPPNSPGLVLPMSVPSTNDRIDFFALDPSSTSEIQSEIDNLGSDSVAEKNCTASTHIFPSSSFQRSGASAQIPPSPGSDYERINIKVPESLDTNEENKTKMDAQKSESDMDLNLNLTTSADSYYSRSRKGRIEQNLPKHSNKLRYRRTSDVSDKSDRSIRSDYYGSVKSSGSLDSGSASGSFLSDSDVDVYGSPTLKYMNRKSPNGGNSDSLTPLKSIENSLQGKHLDDGIVYRALSEVSESIPPTPQSRSRSSSRSRSGSRSGSRSRKKGWDETKESEKEGDASATAQIFKNMLILEESLRQQYMQQQSLRLKYSIFLVVMVIIFSYSTYVSLFHSMYVDVNDINMRTEVFNHNDKGLIDVAITASIKDSETASEISKSDVPDFPLIARLTEGFDLIHQKKRADSSSDNSEGTERSGADTRDTRYVLTNIVHQVISIIMLMTLLLFYLTGEYTRTISIPRKFLVTTNKGIRQLNVRLVKVKVPLKERIIGFIHLQLHNHRQGVDHARLVLNPRVFSTATREQWELYRNQFWGLESVRSRLTSAKNGKKC